jgi:hypothetical protein
MRAVQQQLASEFREIRTTSVENLLYVKEDLIIPHVCLLALLHGPFPALMLSLIHPSIIIKLQGEVVWDF